MLKGRLNFLVLTWDIFFESGLAVLYEPRTEELIDACAIVRWDSFELSFVLDAMRGFWVSVVSLAGLRTFTALTNLLEPFDDLGITCVFLKPREAPAELLREGERTRLLYLERACVLCW